MSAQGPGQYGRRESTTPVDAEAEKRLHEVAGTPSIPPRIPSLPPPPPRAEVDGSGLDMSTEHRWLADPRLALLRRAVSDERLVAIHRLGIDPVWTTNQIAGHMHAMLEKKADRKVFESLLVKCDDKADLMDLVYSTLSALPPEVIERITRRRELAR